MNSNKRQGFCAAIFGVFILSASVAQAQSNATSRFQILLDTDNKATTGCSLTTPGGRFDGAEQIVTTTVLTTPNGGNVTTVSRQTCLDPATATFSSPQIFDTTGWVVPTAGGKMIVESHLPLLMLGNTAPVIRIGLVISTDTTSTSIFTDANGNPILYPAHGGHRRAISAPGGDRSIILGSEDGWTGIDPVLNLSGNDRFLATRMFELGGDLFFRIDVSTQPGQAGFPLPPLGIAPIALDDPYDVVQGHSVHLPKPGVLDNDVDPTDPTKQNLTATLVTPPQHGNLNLSPDGSFTYFHDGSAPVPDTFRYKASNGAASSNTATATFTVNPDRAPIAIPHTYNVPHGGMLTVPKVGGVLTGAFDPEGDAIRAVLSLAPAHGTLVLNNDGSFIYTHDGSNTTSDQFTFRASDGIVLGGNIIVTITIGPNTPPTAVNDPAAGNTAAYTVLEGGTLNVPAAVGLIANDTDPDTPKAQWTVSVVTPPAHGTVTVLNDGSFQYHHDHSETTSDTFTYRDNDGIANSNTATVTLTITPVNDPPVAVNDGYTTLEDQALNVPAKGVLANDTDPDLPPQTLSAVLVSNVAHGTLALNANGSFLYTPSPNYNGVDSFTYKANDGALDSNVATVTITVTAVNDVPSFTAGGNVTLLEDAGAQSITWATAISAGPADEAGQTLNFNIVGNSNGALFSVQPAISPAGVLTFTAAPNANGSATLQVNLHDNGGTANGGVDTSATVSFDIIVTPVNDAPSFTKGADQTVLEDAGAQTVTNWATAISAGPADEAGQTLNFLISNDNNGLFSLQPAIAANGTLTYTPATDAFGSATVTVALHDNGGTANGGVDTSANQTFVITVSPVNDVPSFTKGGDQTVLEDAGPQTVSNWATAISAGPATESGQTVNFIVSNDNNALFSAQPAVDAAGTLTYTSAPNANGSAIVTIAIHDNGGTANGGVDTSANQTFNITVTPVNDAPVLSGPHPVTTNYTEGGAAVVIDPTVTVNDVDSANMSGAFIVISGNADGPGNDVLSFVNTPNITGTFVANAGTLTLTGVDTAAAYQAALRSIKFSSISPAPVLAQRYIEYNVKDDLGAVSANVLNFVTITEVNNPPVVTVPSTQGTLEDQPVTISGISVADPDDRGAANLVLSYSTNHGTIAFLTPAIAATASGTITDTKANINAALAGGIVFTPAPDFNGTATITISLNDAGNSGTGGPLSDTKTFNVVVTAVNDVPSFTKGADQTPLEDSGLHTVAGWATALSAGPADESGQTLSFIVSNDNNALFTVQPAVSATGTLTYTLAANASGSATVSVAIHDDGGTANGGVDTSTNQTFTITVTTVNDVPSFTKGADQTVLEDSGAHTVNGWATAISAGPNEGSQTVNFLVSNNNNGLFSVQPAVDASGNLTYTPAPDANGSATVTVAIHDDGGTANGGVDTSANQTFTLTVTPVNDAPSFTKGADQTSLEDAGVQTVNGWATALSAGPPDESGQTLNFIVSNNNNALFTVQPAVSASGVLTYTAAANAFGSATVTVAIHDNGGTANGGVDTSANQTFTITITNVNDVPSFTKGADQTVLEDAAPQTVNGWATAINPGTNEGSQTVNFIVSNNNNGLFSVQPAVSATGVLTYTLTPNANGSATVTVAIHDDGGTANGGVDTSANQTFAINVTPVNDVPSFTKGADQTTLEDAGAQTVNGWATALSAGPPDESGQTLNFIVSNNNNALFSVQPAVSATGDLTYTAAANTFGSATVTVQIHDNGGTANGGVDTSATQTFTITITQVNDVPSFTKGADQTVLEDAAPQTVNAWATAISPGTNEGSQTVNFIVSNDNNALFSVQPAVSATGVLTYTLTPNANGSAIVTVAIHDNGGTANGGVDTSANQTFTITVTPVNDVPSFTKGADQTTLEDAGAQTVNGWATALSAGPPDESGQTLNFIVSNNNNALFSVQPAVSATGVLTYTAAANAFGSATVTVQIHDNGGTANGGVDTSATQTFTITITQVNDVPSFTKGADQSVLEDAAPQTVNGWATAINPGTNEGSQTVNFIVSNNNNGLFSVQPAVSATGVLTYTLAANANGSAIVTVAIHDNGGTANGGVDTSANQTFNITVTPVNDAPSFTFAAPSVFVLKDSGSNILPNWVQNRSKGPADESGQTLTGHMTNDNNALFTVQPSVDMTNGWVSFTTAPGMTGDATVSLYVTDDGGTANGGIDTSTTQTFILTIEGAPEVTSTVPVGGGTIARNATVTINFSEPVYATTSSFTVSCASVAQVFTISASPASSFTLTPAVSQGSLWTAGTCSATVLAAQISDVDTNDPPDHMAADYNFTFITNTPPTANPDTIHAVTNATLTVPVGQGVLVNDTDPDSGQTLTVTTTTATGSNGGTVTFAADGSYTYISAPGFNGSDVFNYTISDGAATASSTLTVITAGHNVFVKNDYAGATADGRDSTPFKTLATAQAGSIAGDTIYVRHGDGTNTGYGAFTFKANQVMIGEGVATPVTVTTTEGIVVTLMPSGTAPNLGGTLTLSTGNTLRGVALTTAAGTGILGNAFGTFTVDQTSVASTGGPALDLTTGTLAATDTFTSISSTNSATAGVNFNAVAGTLTVSAGSITGSTGPAFNVTGGSANITWSGSISQGNAAALVNVTGTHTGTLTFQTGTLSATAGSGLQFATANGTYNFNGTTTLNGGGAQINIGSAGGTFSFGTGTTVTNPAATAFVASGSPNVTFSGSLSTNTNNGLVTISGQTAGTITFQTGTLAATSGSGISLSNADGTVNFNSASTTIGGTATTGFAVTAGSSGTFNFAGTQSISVSGTGFTVDSSNATFNYPGTINSTGGFAVRVNALSGGAPTFSGNLTSGTNITPTGLGISVTNSTAGTTTFSAGSKSLFTGTNPGVTLTSNTGSTINFTNGGLAISTTSGTAFNATGGGTISATGAGNTIQTTTGSGVNLSSVTIGGGHLTFASVNTATVGGSGVALSSVSGGNLAINGGTVSGTTGISGTTFGNLAVSGVTVVGTANAALNLTTGTIVTGSTFTSVTSTTPGVNNGVSLVGVGGSFTVQGGTLTGGSTLAPFNVAGSSFTATWQGSISEANNAPLVNITNNGVTNDTSSITFNTGTLSATNGTGLQFAHGNGTYTFNGTTTLNGGDAGVDITTGSTGTYSFGIGVTITNPTGTGFTVNTSTPNVTYSGDITKNGAGAGLAVDLTTVASGTITFQGGTITDSAASGTGILLSNVDGTVNFNGTTTLSGGNNGVDVNGGSAGTINFSANASITNPSAELFSIQASSVNFTYSGSFSKSNATRGIFINGETGGTILFDGNPATKTKSVKPTTGKAIEIATNGATINFTNGTLDLSSSGANTFDVSGGGTITVTGTSNTISTTNGTALSIVTTTIGAANVNFQSINDNGGTNAIVLNTTGASGALIVDGDGSATRNSSGGTLQNQTGDAILLTSTRNTSFNHVNIQSTSHNGVKGTGVVNFTFKNGTVNNSGTASATGDSNIYFDAATYGSPAGNENNLSGTVTIDNNALTNAFYHGVTIFNYAGNISNVSVSNNTITSSTVAASSNGDGIRLIGFGSASTVSTITKGHLDGNTITNFPSGAGIALQVGNVTAGGPAGTYGTPGSGVNVITMNSNLISGPSAAVRMGTNAILAALVGFTDQGNFDMSNNGTAGNPVQNTIGNALDVSAKGSVTLTATVNSNFVTPNNGLAGHAISIASTLQNAITDVPVLTFTANGNTINNASGVGLQAAVTNCNGKLKAIVTNNTVTPGAGTQANKSGILVSGGTAATDNVTVCVTMTGNNATGTGANVGFGNAVRKQGTNAAVNYFAVIGAPGPTPIPQANIQAYLNANNTGGGLVTSGDNFQNTCPF